MSFGIYIIVVIGLGVLLEIVGLYQGNLRGHIRFLLAAASPVLSLAMMVLASTVGPVPHDAPSYGLLKDIFRFAQPAHLVLYILVVIQLRATLVPAVLVVVLSACFALVSYFFAGLTMFGK